MTTTTNSTTSEVRYLSGDWLLRDNTEVEFANSSACVTWPPWTTTDCWYGSQPKVRLTIKQVEWLRWCCHTDRRLREICQEFAPFIEIVVSFDE